MDLFNFKPRTTSEVDSEVTFDVVAKQLQTLATNLKNKSFMIFLVLKVTKIVGIMVQFWNLENFITSYLYQALMNQLLKRMPLYRLYTASNAN